ncbi:MAG TPA: hypothetical protein VH601_13825 [Bryobacteraceae bacterium]|jgi:Spy/CpxP family protein refolding chaperone
MKRQIVTLAVSTILGTGLALAAPQTQDQAPAPESNQATHGRRQMDPDRQVKMLAKRLNLTEDQQNKILPILTDQQQQMKSIFSDSSLSQQDRRAKMQTVREDSDTKIKAVLNDNQKQIFDQMQQQRKERMQQWRKEHAKGTDGSGNQS